MTDNFEELETGQIEIMHQQTHDRLSESDNCDALRVQHDSLAAELVKRGLPHDTEIVCPEVETNAPNYRRGFTDDVCTHCAFGQLFPYCNLYNFDYTKGYTCDSFRYYEIMELEPPHGFLMAQEKKIAIARIEPLDNEKSYLIVSNGEVFGTATFEEQPAQVKTKEFDSLQWRDQHKITPRERRQWWPDTEVFYVYRVKDWTPYEGIKLYEDGQVINEPKLTSKQWQMVSAAKELPKQITLIDDAVSITEDQKFFVFPGAKCEELDAVLSATYEIDIKEANEDWGEVIPIYSLALIRNPRMRVVKKSEKQEGDVMPYEIETRDGEFCVIKTEDGESVGCHETREDAESQLTALRINVEEGESAVHTDKPKKRKPKKKEPDIIPETVKKAGFMEGLRNVAKSIGDFLNTAETEENEVKLFVNEVGVAQKEVNGELWHFTWSTNAFEDREKEIFSTDSLKRYVDQAKETDKGFFNLWHMRGTDFATKEWQMVIGRFLVEAGPYLDSKAGDSAKEFFKQYPSGHPDIAPEGWGCSPEFRYLPEERATGTYENIWITRTSTLPKMAAANIWTETSQLTRSKMAITDYSEDQIKAAVEVFKDEDFVKSLIQQGETKTAELEAAGIAHKENSKKDEPEPEPQQVNIDIEDLAVEVGKQFTANLDPIADALATVISDLNELKEWKAKQEKEAEVKAITETPRYTFELQRASQSDSTIVTEDDGLKDQKPNEAKGSGKDSWSQIFNR